MGDKISEKSRYVELIQSSSATTADRTYKLNCKMSQKEMNQRITCRKEHILSVNQLKQFFEFQFTDQPRNQVEPTLMRHESMRNKTSDNHRNKIIFVQPRAFTELKLPEFVDAALNENDESFPSK